MSAAAKPSGRGLAVYVAAYLVFLYLPVVLIPLFSFNNSVQAAFPLQGFTLDWYRALWGNDTLKGALKNSLTIGFSAATCATLCGITVAYAELALPGRAAWVVANVARLPMLIPGVIVGVALLILVNIAGLGPSRLSILLGHVLIALPTTIILFRGAFASIPRSIPDAAADLGARPSQIFLRVMLPLALPTVGSAFLLAFLTSFDEFIVAFFLAGTEPTLPLYIWSQLRFPKSLPMVMALGSAILLASILIASAAEVLRRRGLRR